MGISYEDALVEREEAEELARCYEESLRDLISHCVSAEAGGYTPSDFPIAGLTQSDLDLAFAEVEFEEM